MRQWLQVMAVSLAALGAVPSAAASSPKTVAIAYFDNHSGQPDLEPLRKGLADMLITDLSNLSPLRVVERARLNDVLGELKLSSSKFIDPATAQKLGKGLAAEFILTGSYVLAKKQLRIDARLIKVQSGAIVTADHVEGPQDDFFSLEKDLVDLLVRGLELKVANDERGKLRRNQTESFDAWSKYSAALEACDQGDNARAQRLFQAAVESDPGYRAARTQLERTEALLRAATDRQSKAMDVHVRRLDPQAPDFARRAFEILSTAGMSEEAVRQKIEILTLIAENRLHPSWGEGLTRVYPEGLHLPVLAMNYFWDPETVELLPPVFEYILRKYPDDVTLTGSNMRDSPKQVQQQIESMRASPDHSQLMRTHFETLEYARPYLKNRKAAQQLFRMVAKQLPAAKK
ncbi:MAG: hypothetical protein HY901_07060 [Deltaproteobacteria bacterium]|nr:hypothetical protein [Deltaproteobacteria bacterium]